MLEGIREYIPALPGEEICMERMDRINQFIKREISQMMLLGEIRDPRVIGVTITYVDVSKDLSWAHVGFSILSDDPEAIRRVQGGLDSARGMVRRLIGQRVTIRHIPEVKFVYDNTIAQGVHMTKLFNELEAGRAQHKSPVEGEVPGEVSSDEGKDV
ncbi:MAG: 30S ribosome-binding factor RbfA, partial [Candidatus Omnitrophota bacterium]